MMKYVNFNVLFVINVKVQFGWAIIWVLNNWQPFYVNIFQITVITPQFQSLMCAHFVKSIQWKDRVPFFVKESFVSGGVLCTSAIKRLDYAQHGFSFHLHLKWKGAISIFPLSVSLPLSFGPLRLEHSATNVQTLDDT